MKRFITDDTRTMEESSVSWRPTLSTPEMNLVKAYPTVLHQQFVGMGAALTEASGYVFAQMDAETRKRFLDLCFGADGSRYSLCRLSIQSCDFSLTPRAYANPPRKKGETACDFSIEDDWAYVLPLVKAAQETNPQLQFLASPWSPPAWAKTNRNMKYGGLLRSSHYGTWADIVARALDAYRQAGVPIDRITVQNEPNARQTWESCLFNAKQEATFLHDHLKGALEAHGLGHVKTFIWDHNKEGAVDRAMAVMADPDVAADVDGVAFHWYSGDHFEAVRAVRDLIGPDRELIFTEGCDYHSDGNDWAARQHAEHYAHEIIGDLEAGANGILDWNILLDAQGGPNHVGNFCDAPIMYDCESGQLNVRRPFYYLQHFSKFIAPGARHMLVTRYFEEIETCGFVNPDGSCALVVLNRYDHPVPFDLTLGNTSRLGTRIAHLDAPARSIQTICW